jgi:hypothetical protein
MLYYVHILSFKWLINWFIVINTSKRRLNSFQWCPLWRPPLYCSRSLYTNQVIEHLYFGRCASISKRIPSMQFDCSNRINAGWIYLLQVPLSLQMLLWKFKSWLTTYTYSYTWKDDNLLMSRSKGQIRQDLFSVINNTGTIKQCRMSEETGCGILKYSGTCVIWHLNFPTSCDFRQEFQVPKYFFNILC